MGLIKAPTSPSAAASAAVPFSMRDIEEQARALIVRARQRADQLLAAAQVEAEAMQTAAHAQGLAEGRAEGLTKGTDEGRKAGQQQALSEHKAQLATVVQTLSQAATELDAARHDLETEALCDVVSLAVSIARRVTKRQAAIDPLVLAENVSEAMKLVVHTADVRIAIHPSQRATLLDVLPKLQMTWPALAHVELIEDATLAPGGCRILTRGGQVNADIDGQLDRIVANLLPSEGE